MPFPCSQEYNALITDCFQEDPAARPKMEAVLERLVRLQQRIIKRQHEADAALAGTPASAGGAAPSAAVRLLSGGGSGCPPGRTFVAAVRHASSAASLAASAAAAQWRHQKLAPAAGWMLVAGLPVLTAMLSWAAARRIYSQK